MAAEKDTHGPRRAVPSRKRSSLARSDSGGYLGRGRVEKIDSRPLAGGQPAENPVFCRECGAEIALGARYARLGGGVVRSARGHLHYTAGGVCGDWIDSGWFSGEGVGL